MLSVVRRPPVRLVGMVLTFGLFWTGVPQGAAAAELKVGAAVQASSRADLVKSPSGLVSVIVKYDADSLASYKGGVNGLAATSPEARGGKRLDASSSAYKAYENFLIGKERTFEAALGARVPGARIVHRYRTIIGGVSVIVPRDRVAALKNLPGVKAVYPDQLLTLDTDRSPAFIGAPALWNQVGGQSNAGKGVIVGIVDTGIWPEHPSVADTGFPAPPPHWLGTACEFSGGSNPGDPFACNHKLIGAQRFLDTFDASPPAGLPLAGEFTTARDNNGHGSHTMTTAAGNADVEGLGQILSGIAPAAQVAAYKVCFTAASGGGSCFSSDSAAAIEQAIVDGVDVINFSISGGTNPYSDIVSLAFLDAYAAGVFVACSAGNSGPTPETVAHREPWTTSTAALTTDKGFNGHADLTSDAASLTVTGVSATGGVGPFPIVLSSAAPYSNDLCLTPAAAGIFTGKIVACKRGTNARAQKSANVAAGGAAGMILYNFVAGTLNADVHAVPSLHIDHVQGASLVAFINAQTNEAATLTRDATPGVGDVMAGFSSRGGPGQTLGISKPDVGAPGVNILAANTPDLAVPLFPGQADLFQIISGTSMSSPHVAGAGALLMQLHPSWTPGQVKSALMLTATTADTVKEDGVTPTTPFDIGSGRIDLNAAGEPGLTISERAANYVALQNNLERANYPSLYTPVNPGKVSVTRLFKNYKETTATWDVTVDAPADLVVKVPRTLRFTRRVLESVLKIDVDASAVPVGQVRHASLHLRNGAKSLVFPITVVRKNGAITLAKLCDDTSISLGDGTDCSISATNNSFGEATVTITDKLPKQLKLGAVTGADKIDSRNLRFVGTLAGQTAPLVFVAPGSTPIVSYLPLSGFGVTPIAGMGDETLVNFGVPAFKFGGISHTSLAVDSNGYVIPGGGTGADNSFINQDLPNPAAPNNVLAPYWTDLNPGAAGAVRIALLSAGPTTWIVTDWAGVPEFGNGGSNNFQVWIRTGAVEEVTFTYGATGDGDGGFLTVGAENFMGSSGQNHYIDGVGTLPTPGLELVVTTTPGAPGETHTILYEALGKKLGVFRNCAELTSDALFGTAVSCFDGEVVVPAI